MNLQSAFLNNPSFDGARIGIDIGRVIMAATDEGGRADTSFLDGSDVDAMRTPPNDRAFEVMRELVTVTNGNVWLVSKCGPRVQSLTRRWLAHWTIFAETGLREGHVRFCLKRPDKAKHARELGLTHFIDDRLDVHEHLRGIVPHRYLFGHQRAGTMVPHGITHVTTWPDVRRALLGDREVTSCATPAEGRPGTL